MSALDWPGLARGAKTEDPAIELLLAALPRYARVARAAGERFDPTDMDLVVADRVPGDAGTEWGLPWIGRRRGPASRRTPTRPGALPRSSRPPGPSSTPLRRRHPRSFRKGPRGGGRDRTKIVAHVDGADGAYAATIGAKGKVDTRAQVEALRAAVLDVLRTPADGSPIAGKKWPPRYAARRIAWHALDHAWEIEDRTDR